MLGIEWKYQGRFGKLVSESAGIPPAGVKQLETNWNEMETTMEVPGIAFPAIVALAMCGRSICNPTRHIWAKWVARWAARVCDMRVKRSRLFKEALRSALIEVGTPHRPDRALST